MQLTASNLDEVTALVVGLNRIGIDGVDGTGKSFLAEHLGAQLNIPVINRDSHIVQNMGCYVAALRSGEVAEMARRHKRFIVEGVCLLDAIEVADITIDKSIYIKRMHLGLWSDEDDCVFPNGVEAAIVRVNHQMNTIAKCFGETHSSRNKVDANGGLELTAEIMRYHDK